MGINITWWTTQANDSKNEKKKLVGQTMTRNLYYHAIARTTCALQKQCLNSERQRAESGGLHVPWYHSFWRERSDKIKYN